MAYKNVTQEYHAKRRLKESNLLCVLTAVGQHPVNKKARVHSDGSFDYAEPSLPKNHTHQIYRVSSTREMGHFLTDLEKKPRSFLVYGLPNKDLIPGKRVLRRKVNFVDRKTKWLILDFDNIVPPSWTNETSPKKTFSMLWQAMSDIPGVASDIPPGVWQLSNSWGDTNKEVPKCHAFLELDNPISVGRLRAWADHCHSNLNIQIDKSIYQRTQPIYTARPTLIGTTRAHELNELQRVYVHPTGPSIISSELILNLPEARDAQIPIERTGDNELFEYVLSRIEEEGLIRQSREGGKYDIVCPLANEHSGGENDTSSTMWAPSNGKGPAFHCQHTNSHTSGRNGWQWFLSELTDQGIIEKKHLHSISQESAKTDFVIKGKHPSQWTVDDLQQNYIYVTSQNSVFSIADKTILDTSAISHLHPQVFESPEAKYAGEKPKKGMAALVLANMKHPGCKVVTSERFDPSTIKLISNRGEMSYLNSWRGFSHTPTKGDVSVFYEHINTLCPDSAEAEAFADYLGHLIQCPWERPTWSPVHISIPQGLGRGILNKLIQDIVTPYYSSPSPKDIFNSNFNGFLKNTIWIGIEETSVHAAKGVSAQLRELITATSVDINNKYGKILPNYPVYARLFFMANELDALPLDESDRRFWIFGPNEDGYCPREHSYYDRVVKTFMNPGFQAAVLHDLLNRDISRFSPGHIPFKTSLKAEMQDATRVPAMKALNHIQTCGHFVQFMNVNKIIRLVREYVKENQMSVSDTEIRAVLRGLPTYNKSIKINNKNIRFKILFDTNKMLHLPISEVRKVLDSQQEVPLDWYKK